MHVCPNASEAEIIAAAQAAQADEFINLMPEGYDTYVGERGVPLSPDTLVLPAAVDALPASVLEAAMRVLGQGWSIANARQVIGYAPQDDSERVFAGDIARFVTSNGRTAA